MKCVAVALTILAVSALAHEEVPCACPRDFNPVCATDNTMYSNLCSLQCVEGKELATDKFYNRETEKCENLCMCTADWTPVCATDRTMFANLCNLNCSGEKTHDKSKVYNQETQQCEQAYL